MFGSINRVLNKIVKKQDAPCEHYSIRPAHCTCVCNTRLYHVKETGEERKAGNSPQWFSPGGEVMVISLRVSPFLILSFNERELPLLL